MSKESIIQGRMIKYLKSKGCYVVKTQAGPGVPTGCPDIFFFKEGLYGAIEVKSSRTAAWQPLQKETLAKLDAWSFGTALYPENYDQVIAELELLI